MEKVIEEQKQGTSLVLDQQTHNTKKYNDLSVNVKKRTDEVTIKITNTKNYSGKENRLYGFNIP